MEKLTKEIIIEAVKASEIFVGRATQAKLWSYDEQGQLVPIEQTKKFHEAMKEAADKFMNDGE